MVFRGGKCCQESVELMECSISLVLNQGKARILQQPKPNSYKRRIDMIILYCTPYGVLRTYGGFNSQITEDKARLPLFSRTRRVHRGRSSSSSRHGSDGLTAPSRANLFWVLRTPNGAGPITCYEFLSCEHDWFPDCHEAAEARGFFTNHGGDPK